MFDVGIDFGSTYTTVSVYRQEKDSLSAKALSEAGTPFIPSVLAVSKDKISIGKAAKTMTMMAGHTTYVKTFRAFKMMLAEDDPECLRLRGFDEEYTPSRVTHDFLEMVLRRIMERENEWMIDHLVVGVPEIWNTEIHVVDARARLLDICRSFSFLRKDERGVPNVQIVSEPIAASAYFAYNYQQQTGNDFDGKLLLIDYGGGTLDITLTDVETRPDDQGKEAMEIRILKRTGAGENEEKRVGCAGIVYMETLMETAIKARNPELEVVYDPAFYRAVDDLELQLQDCTSAIKGIFDEYGVEEDELDEEVMDDGDFLFTRIAYKGEFYDISYQMLVQVYNAVIQPVLEAKMNEVISFMKNQNMEFMDRNADQFKIVLVGGFGNFYLVKKQVSDKFAFSSTDRRLKYVIRNQEDCEKAISLGSALLASGNIRIRNTAPYSIGVCGGDGKEISLTYGLHRNQDIEFGQVYDQKDAKGNAVIFLSASGGITRFLINTHDDEREALIMKPKEAFQEVLKDAIGGPDHMAAVGFSLDSSGVLALHICDYDLERDMVNQAGRRIELTNFRELFDIHEIERVYKDE